MADYLASVTYLCKTSKGQSYKLTLDMITNKGFEYGNRKALAVFEGNGNIRVFDARYDKRFNTVEKFFENALDFLKQEYDIADSELIEKKEQRGVVQ